MNTMRKQLLAAAITAAALSGDARAQLVVNSSMTPEQLVNDVLLGGGVSVSNITFNGGSATVLNEQIGSFNGVNCNVGIEEGLFFASGSVEEGVGPNNNGSITIGGGNMDHSDPDLVMLSNGPITDAAVLEFDFIPSGDSLKFSYVFASDEYPEFVCSYNDAFGFFLSGPGISGPYTNNAINIALVPTTTMPVTIDNVNNGYGNDPNSPGCGAVNPQYYIANGDGYTSPWDTDPYYIQYDGFTRVLEARAAVQCGQTYHIKLAVGDAGGPSASDTGYDSGVFLQAGSFASIPFVPGLVPGPGIVADTIFESCFPVQLAFVRLSDPSSADTVQIAIGGTATANVDYSPALPTQIIFEPGVTSIPFSLNVPVDPDGTETVVITVFVESPCTDEIFSEDFEFYIKAVHPVIAIGSAELVVCGDSALLEPDIVGGYGLYEYAWSTGQTTPTIWYTPTENTDVTVQVTDACGITTTAFFAVGIQPPPALTASLIGPEDLVEGCPTTDLVVHRPAGMGGDLEIVFGYPGQAQGADFGLPASMLLPAGQNSITLPVLPVEDGQGEGTEAFIITAGYMGNACGQSGSASVDGTISDAPAIEITAQNIVEPCGADSLPISVQAVGGVGSLDYVWNTGHTGPTAWATGYYDNVYVVTVTDDCGRSSTASIFVDVLCDLLVPNVITPNGDGENDRWIIQGIQASRNTVRVFNRWGKAVFEATDYRNTWTPPASLPDGTYFYEIIVDTEEKPLTGSLSIIGGRH